MKKILFITYYWPPSGGAGVQRGSKFVKYLPEHGVQPIVLTVDPARASYPSVDPSLEADVPRETRVIRTSSVEPLRMLAAVGGKKAVPHAGFAGTSKPGLVQRLLRWVRGNWFIPDARRGWVKHAVKAAVQVIQQEGIDTIIISSPPHSSQLIGLELRKRFPRLRWIADLRDPWTDIYFAKDLHMGAAAQRRNARWEERVMRKADALVVVGPSMKRAFSARYGGEVERKISVIPNGYDQADLDRVGGAAPPVDRFRITYVGTMAGSYDPRAFFTAVRAVVATGARIELRFVGSIAHEVRAMVEEAGLTDHSSWRDTVEHDEALREMHAAHALLLVIPTGEGAEAILTGKLFEYLGVRRPIIGLGPDAGDAAAIIRECAAGEMFERHEVEPIAAWITARIGAPRTTDGNGLHTRYERREQARELARLIISAPAG